MNLTSRIKEMFDSEEYNIPKKVQKNWSEYLSELKEVANLASSTKKTRKTHKYNLKSGDEDFVERAQKEYGLFPKKEESTKDFEKRVYDTVHYKNDPMTHPLLKAWTKESRAQVTTEEVQDIALKYLGITNPPIDAFENHGKNRGVTVDDTDGSSIILTEDLPDNTEGIVDSVAKNMIKIINNETIEFIPNKNKNYKKLYNTAGFQEDDNLNSMFKKTYEQFIDNETFVKLHEVIHAIHLNNHEYGRRNTNRKLVPEYASVAILSLLPVIGPIYRAKRFNFHVETESFAYKVGLDEYSKDILEQAAKKVNKEQPGLIGDLELQCFKDEFKEMNTSFAKAIIKHGYLNTALKGYGFARADYRKAFVRGIVGSYLMDKNGWFAQGVGALFLLSAANNLVKSGFSAYFEKKIDKTVDMVEALSEKFDGGGKAFYNSLGKNRSELEAMVK